MRMEKKCYNTYHIMFLPPSLSAEILGYRQIFNMEKCEYLEKVNTLRSSPLFLFSTLKAYFSKQISSLLRVTWEFLPP